jgi:hypothetical protein
MTEDSEWEIGRAMRWKYKFKARWGEEKVLVEKV